MENIRTPELAALIDKYSPFLEEVRKRIVFTLSFFIVAVIAGFLFYENIIKFLIGNLALEGTNIVFTAPFQFVNLAISCGLVTGLIVIFPLIIGQILAFLKPALKSKEYKIIVQLIPFSLILFVIGFIFGVVVMRWQIKAFVARSVSLGIGNMLDISGLLTTVLLTAAAMGLCFQFPIVLLILLRINIIDRKQLGKARPWIYLGTFVFTLFLPLDSVLADLLLTIPLVLLFEITLLIDLILGGKKRKKQKQNKPTPKQKPQQQLPSQK